MKNKKVMVNTVKPDNAQAFSVIEDKLLQPRGLDNAIYTYYAKPNLQVRNISAMKQSKELFQVKDNLYCYRAGLGMKVLFRQTGQKREILSVGSTRTVRKKLCDILKSDK